MSEHTFNMYKMRIITMVCLMVFLQMSCVNSQENYNRPRNVGFLSVEEGRMLMKQMREIRQEFNALLKKNQDINHDIEEMKTENLKMKKENQIIRRKLNSIKNENQFLKIHQENQQKNMMLNVMAEVDVVNKHIDKTVEELHKDIAQLQKSSGSVSACSSSPCDNNGSCIDVNDGIFICMCRDGYFGEICQNTYSDATVLAAFSGDYVMPSTPLVFDVARINTGGYYDNNTGIYTVPYTGIYKVTAHMRSYQDENYTFYVTVNGTPVTGEFQWDPDNSEQTGHTSILLPLTEGDTVYVYSYSIGQIRGTNYENRMESWFCVHLINAL